MNIARANDKNSPRRVAAVGMWDGVHLGHRSLIDAVRREAKARGLVPAVVTFEQHPLSVVRPEAVPPLLTLPATRLDLLDAAGVADCVLLHFDSKLRRLSARQFLSMLKERYAIDVLLVGFNNRFGHDRVEGIEAYRAIGTEIGMEIVAAPEFRLRRTPVSSSAIRALLAEGRVGRAAQLLGRPFTLGGTVGHGRQLGRTIGFPTANLQLPEAGLAVPAAGAYACMAVTPDGVRRPAMVNIGHRPTVDTSADAPATIEAHILDFAGDIYGRPLTVEFHKRLRPEKRFESVDALARQLARDARATLRALS